MRRNRVRMSVKLSFIIHRQFIEILQVDLESGIREFAFIWSPVSILLFFEVQEHVIYDFLLYSVWLFLCWEAFLFVSFLGRLFWIPGTLGSSSYTCSFFKLDF